MSKNLFFVALALLAIARPTQAQSVFNPNPPVVAPYARPALSPYLNLLRGGDPAANYYLGVLTEYDRRFQLSRPLPSSPMTSLRGDAMLDDRADLDVPIRELPPTGHSAGFMIYNSYFRVPNQRGFIPYNPMGNNLNNIPR